MLVALPKHISERFEDKVKSISPQLHRRENAIKPMMSID